MADTNPNGLIGLQGINNKSTESAVNALTVGVDVVQVAKNNPNRLAGLFINTSANLIYLNVTPDVTATNGILLLPNGGAFNTKSWEDYGFTGFPFYATASAADSSLTFVETQLNN